MTVLEIEHLIVDIPTADGWRAFLDGPTSCLGPATGTGRWRERLRQVDDGTSP
jgi:hypothetical protein